MINQITAKQLIEKLKILDPDYKFDTEPLAHFPDDNNENCIWVQGVYLDKKLFGTYIKGEGYVLADNFDKLFVNKDKYYQTIYSIIEEYDFGCVAQYSSDEYSGEVKVIIQRLPKCPTIESIQVMLYNLFVEYFGKNHIIDNLDLYKEVAQKLYNLEVIE